MNVSTVTRFKKREKGSSVVEFAVVLPILLAFLFGILEFGRVMMVCHTLNNAARAGARIAVLPGADNSAVLNAINSELSGSGLTMDVIEFSPSDVEDADRDDPVTVSVKINYDSIGFVTGFFPMLNGVQFKGTAVMRKEGFI
jgi:Flp pilus assembly protein TadG